jgi:ABC-type nitrate/sulfonate/bicarbonate transport system substrate-binding protein
LQFRRFLPLIVAAILALSVALYIEYSLPASSGATTTINVVYPDALDESEVTDQFAFQILQAEGYRIVPTYYDMASLAYDSLISGHADIAYDETLGSFQIGGSEQTTCVGGYTLGGAFLAISSEGITSPSQLLGKTGEDSGPGTITRYLNDYWFKQAGVAVSSSGVSSSAIFLKVGRENYDLVHDMETGVAQEIVVDDFILPDLESPQVNNTANHGPFHVLFQSPDDILQNCYAVRDSWLSSPANQRTLVKFLAAEYEAQRIFISSPAAFVPFAQKFLPLSSPTEIQYTSVYYPSQFIYWPYGMFNLQGSESVGAKFQETVNFLVQANALSSPVKNSSVSPYGIVNKYFELAALQSLGTYNYPAESWVTPSFSADVHAWVPSWMGS